MVEVYRFSKEFKNDWNSFLDESKNGNFLFNRNYMDYHAERFNDSSLIFTKRDKVIGLFPANIDDQSIISHGGLTYGGIVNGYDINIKTMIEIFDLMINHYKTQKIKNIIYKPIPFIYHNIPSAEDLWLLYKYKAKLIKRDISSVISLSQKIRFSKQRRRGIKKAKKENLTIKSDNNFDVFLHHLADRLKEKYETSPVHSVDELELLSKRFPQNIIQYSVYENEKFLAGVIIYLSENVAHSQYIVSTLEGQQIGALDYLFDFLINEEFSNYKYFDFGISTEKDGKHLNEGLIHQKEGFGARGVTYDTYEITVNG
jgi:hypothetical protein